MKNKHQFYLIAILLVLNNCVIQAQNFVNGGNAITGTAVLGQTNNNDLQFITNNANAMILKNSGNIGIGTTSPSYKLDVKETANNANATIRAQATGTNGNANLILNKTATGDNCMVNYKYGSGAGLVNLWAAGCRTNDDFSIYNESLAATNFMVQKSTGFVGIGTTSPSAKLHVDLSNSASSTINNVSIVTFTETGSYNSNYVSSSLTNVSGTGNTNFGFYPVIVSTGTSNTNFGVNAVITNSSTDAGMGAQFTCGGGYYNVGVEGKGADGISNFGVHGIAEYGSSDNYGVRALARGNLISGGNIHGVDAEAEYTSGTFTSIYGIRAKGPSSCALSGGSLVCPRAAGYFDGDVGILGNLYQTSDLNLKQNIAPLQYASAILAQLQPKTFEFQTQNFPSMSLSEGQQYGLIAQEVETVLPNLVRGLTQPDVKDSLGTIIYPSIDFKTVNYTALIPFLIQGFKEQQHQIDSLIAVIGNSNPSPLKIQNQNTIEVELSNQAKIILNTNDPNPFSESTTINYFIPESSTNVQLLFYDNIGTILKTIDIKEKGQGSVLVYGSNLTSGTYTYTLLANGKIIDSKRMVKVK